MTFARYKDQRLKYEQFFLNSDEDIGVVSSDGLVTAGTLGSTKLIGKPIDICCTLNAMYIYILLIYNICTMIEISVNLFFYRINVVNVISEFINISLRCPI